MSILTYSTQLTYENPEDKGKLLKILEAERTLFNFCSNKHFGSKTNSIKELHSKCYAEIRRLYPEVKSQIIIKAENACLSTYRSVKSNKHKLSAPIIKKRLSISLDKRLQRVRPPYIYITTLEKRVKVKPVLYPKLQEMLDSYEFGDLLLFEKNGELWISFFFRVPDVVVKPKLALGVDLGIRRFAATSDGQLFIDKNFNKKKRELRYLKSKLRSRGSKSSKRRLRKLRKTERNRNRELCHQLSNKLLKTTANILVLEDLDCIQLKKKKHAYQNKNRISQVGFAEIRRILTYKAGLVDKQVVCVNPAYTSQTDCITGKREGERVGTRFYAKSGLVYDADINAAVNIARLSKLPALLGNLLSGQAVVNQPIVGTISAGKPPNLFGGI